MTEEFTTELPDDYPALLQVGSLKELFDAADKVGNEVNVIVWRRGEISGEFNGLAQTLAAHYGQGSESTNPCDLLVNDRIYINDRIMPAFELLREDLYSFKPYIDSNSAVRWVGDQGYVRDFVNNFHKDYGIWRLMSCYNDPATEWVKNEDISHKIKPKDSFDKDIFEYIPIDDAVIHRFAQGDVWLHAGHYKPLRQPFIHRGTKANQRGLRLLFAS